MSKPSSPVAYADITAPTNQNVTVYATFDETAVVCKYAIDTPNSWYDYTENGVVLSKNGKVYFACANANDEGSDMTTFEVTNIDKVAPDAPVVSVESAASFDGVLVSAAFSKDSVVQEYSFEGQRWIQYEGAISVMNADTEIFFRATDAAGNESFAEYKAENFPVGGNEGLDAPVVRPSTTEPTNTDVFVTAIFDSDAAVNQFSTDGQTWEEYADGINGIPFAENGTVSFRSLDAAGSASPTTTYEVTNIDKIPPDAPVISVTQADTFEGVIVSAAFSKDSVYQEYSFEGKKWMQYEGAITVTESGTVVLFRATDAAGNESTTTYEFTGATGGETGLAAPTVTADILAFTNTDVVLSVSYSDEAYLKEYSLDRRIWLAFPTTGTAIATPVSGGTTTMTDGDGTTAGGGTRSVIPADEGAAPVTLTVTANGTYYFRGTTADGIVSDVTSFTVRNIDKVAPTAPTGLNSWTTENADGSVTLTFGWSESTDDYSGISKYIVSYWQNGSGNITTVETTDKQFSIDFPAPIPSSATGDDGTPIDVDGTVGSSDVTPALASVQVDPSDWSWSVQAVDAAGNLSEAAVLDNGPKIAAPVAIAGNTEPTNMDVYVTARFDETAAVNEYSLDGQTWLPYPEEPVFTGGPIAVSISENGTVYFRSMDADGNYSAVTEIIINNIDKVAPDAPVAFADITEPTNQNVTVYARFSEDSVMRSYAVVDAGSGNWQVYDESTGVVLEYNDTIRFSCVDAAGNYSPVTTFVVSNIDKVAPTKPTVTVTAANLPAGKGLDIAAAFSEDSVKQEYSFDGTTWLEYSGAITVTEVGKKLYFRGTDAAGNVSNSAFYLVDKLSLAPAAPVAYADITEPTNQDVTVYATFDETATVRKYAINTTSSWYDYTDAGVVLTQNGTVYFACVDADGEGSDMTPFVVSNIDKVAPQKPVASADVTEQTNGIVTVTATFSNDSVQRQYSYDGDAWSDYPEDGITFEKNGYVFFRGIDAAGNESDSAVYEVANIVTAEPDLNPADDGWNDAVYDTKAKALTEAAGAVNSYDLTKLYRNVTSFGVSGSILFDEAGSSFANGTQNAAGGTRTENGKTVYDTDFVKIEMSSPGYVCFSVSTNNALNLRLWHYTVKEDGTTLFKKVQGYTFLKAGDSKTAQILLERTEDGVSEYYLSVAGATPKKNGPTYYNISLDVDNSVMYPAADNSDDWTDMKTNGPGGKVRKLGALENHYDVATGFDKNILILDWVGPGDNVDYFQFTLEHAANLSFAIAATGAASFGVYSLKEGKTWKLTELFSQKSLTQGGKIDGNKYTVAEGYEYALTTSEIAFDAGTYYLCVGTVTTKTPGEPGAYYTVDVAGMIAFQANNEDDWTDMKANGAQGHVGNVGKLEDRYTEFEGFNDGALVLDWIGTGDDVDYFKFNLDHNAKLRFATTATDAVSFSLSSLAGIAGNYKLKSLVKVTTLRKGAKIDENEYAFVNGYSWALTTSDVLLKAGTYYIGVKKSYAGKSGSADYAVDLSGKIFLNANTKDNGEQFRKDGSLLDVGSLGLLSDSTFGNRIEEDWVGFGDDVDYKHFLLAGPTKLNFTISATDSVKLTVYEVRKNSKGKATFTAFSKNVATITNKT